jgi:hypothetical protein
MEGQPKTTVLYKARPLKGLFLFLCTTCKRSLITLYVERKTAKKLGLEMA